MPLVIVCGYPASGKTVISTALASYLAPAKVVLINDESVNLKRASYLTAVEEKKARATFMAAVERSLNSETIVIADGMNYIKGYRYQLYCLARAVNTPHCCLQVLATEQGCTMRNASLGEEGYGNLADLISRFEEPNNQVKWDFPLFSCQAADTQLFQEIKEVLLAAAPRPPSLATQAKTTLSGDFIAQLDRQTMEMTQIIIQQLQPYGSSTIRFPNDPTPLLIKRPISQTDLTRLRTRFLHASRQHPCAPEQISTLFKAYLQSNL